MKEYLKVLFEYGADAGMAFKDAGRVGDSALPGCGLYADDDGGAAAATGDGDQILRFCPCLRVVELMRGDNDGHGIPH